MTDDWRLRRAQREEDETIRAKARRGYRPPPANWATAYYDAGAGDTLELTIGEHVVVLAGGNVWALYRILDAFKEHPKQRVSRELLERGAAVLPKVTSTRTPDGQYHIQQLPWWRVVTLVDRRRWDESGPSGWTVEVRGETVDVPQAVLDDALTDWVEAHDEGNPDATDCPDSVLDLAAEAWAQLMSAQPDA